MISYIVIFTFSSIREMDCSPRSLLDLKNGTHQHGDKDFECEGNAIFIKKPEWYNDHMFQRGQQFFFNHRSSIIFSYLWSIMIGFTVDTLTDTLIYTGASSGPKKARQRYLKTLKYLIKWHDGGKS